MTIPDTNAVISIIDDAIADSLGPDWNSFQAAHHVMQWLTDAGLQIVPAARHRLERSEPVGWMGIESAPKDGTPILAYGPMPGYNAQDHGWHEVRETKWKCYPVGSPGYAKWQKGEGPLGIGWDWYEPVHNSSHSWNPTHWMPLPSAPDTTPPEPVAEIERLRDELNKVRGILERLRDFDGWHGTFHAGHAYDAKQEAIAYLKGAS